MAAIVTKRLQFVQDLVSKFIVKYFGKVTYICTLGIYLAVDVSLFVHIWYKILLQYQVQRDFENTYIYEGGRNDE